MCGRYVEAGAAVELAHHYGASLPEGELPPPRYNLTPTSQVPIIAQTPNGRELVTARWGLIPAWQKNFGSRPLFNTRIETAAEKPSFRASVRQHRCLIPADGFYEWVKADSRTGVKKQPYYIYPQHKPGFAFAGLYSWWQDREKASGDASWILSCSILTMETTAHLAWLHHRLPVALPLQDDGLATTWLDADHLGDVALLEELTVAAKTETDTWAWHAVDPRVGHRNAHGPELREPATTANASIPKLSP